MKLDDIMSVAGAALEANTVRMNLAVSNIANAEVMAGNEDDAYKAKRAVFRTILEDEVDKRRGEVSGGVRVQQVIEDTTSHTVSFDPNHPDANEEGYVYLSNVNAMNELVCLLYTSPSPRDATLSRMPSSA